MSFELEISFVFWGFFYFIFVVTIVRETGRGRSKGRDVNRGQRFF